MEKSKTPVMAGELVWQNQEPTMRAKIILIAIAVIMFVIAGEAIRIAATAAITGNTPRAFGIFLTRVLLGFDIPMVLLVALLGIGYVSYRLVKIVFEGLPIMVQVEMPPESQSPGLNVAWDGLSKITRHLDFKLIGEIDVITRGTMGGGGNQVRARIKERSLPLVIARFDNSHEAERLARTLIAQKESALSQLSTSSGV